MSTNLHVVFEDVGGSGHVYDVVDDEFAEGRQQVPPLVQRLDLVRLLLSRSLQSGVLYLQPEYTSSKSIIKPLPGPPPGIQ